MQSDSHIPQSLSRVSRTTGSLQPLSVHTAVAHLFSCAMFKQSF